MQREQTKNIGYKRLTALLVALCIAMPLLISCAARVPAGRIEFHPSLAISEQGKETVIREADNRDETDQNTQGEYSRKGEELRFKNKDLTVVLKGAREDDNKTGNKVFTRLYNREFVLLKMSITNRSKKKKVRYDPAITALLDSNLGYSKPLDYPILYEIAMRDGIEKELTGFRHSFYDLGVTILPLQTLSRYIIFRPISKNARRAKLVIKNMYVGTEVIDLTFEFLITEADKSRE